MKIIEEDGIKYVVTNNGKCKLINIQDHLGLRETLKEFHEFNNSMQGESVSIIFEKYKRTHHINCEALKFISEAIVKERLEKGKTPNRDYITQKLSEYVNLICRKYEETLHQNI